MIRWICTAIVVSAPSSFYAQDAQRVTAAPNANGFYAPYEVVENHPKCSDADEVAFRIQADLGDLAFSARESGSGQRYFGVPNEPFQPSCFMTERRGVESIRIEVDCPANSQRQTEFDAGEAAPKFDLSIDLLSCVSPVGYRTLEGTWKATVEQPSSTRTFEGLFGPDPDGNENPNGIKSRIAYGSAEKIRGFWVDETDEHPLASELNIMPAINVDLFCIPLSLEARENRMQSVRQNAWLFLAKDPPSVCEGANCPLVNARAWHFRRFWRCSE